MSFVPWAILGLSVALNCLLFYRSRKRPKITETLETSALDLLHDLTRRGQAILRVEVIDPARLMLRSPRG